MKWSEEIQFAEPLHSVHELVAPSRQDWETLLRQREEAAYARGRREGEAAVNQQLVQQRAELAELQRGVLAGLRSAVPQVVRETETALLQLSLEAAQKVVAGLPISAQLIDATVREALRQAEDTSEILVKMHPDDLALLQKHGSSVMDSPGNIRFSASAEVTRGGCLLETRFGRVDARREVKWEQIQQTLSA